MRLILLLALVISYVHAEHSCKAVKWPYALKQDNKSFHKIVTLNRYDASLSYYFYEVTSGKPVGIEDKLYKYLKANAPNELLKGFVSTVAWGANKRKKPLSISELCSIYRKTLAHPENSYIPKKLK